MPKRTLAESGASAPKKRKSAAAWLSAGVVVEWADEGMAGTLYRARVLDVKGSKAHIEHEAFNAEDDSDEMLKEWVPASQLSAVPPDPPAGFFGRLKVGAPLCLLHEEGWWKVTLLEVKGAGSAAEYRVGSLVIVNGVEQASGY